jgi:hypothetical protein
LETLGTKSRISITMLPLTLHQWRSLLSHSNNYNNSQCCNSSQWSNPNLSCRRPSNPLFCHHNFQWVSSSSQHQCNCSQSLHWPSLKLSSLCRRRTTPKVQKCRLPAIPEEDEATATRHPKVENPDSPATTRSPGGNPSQAHVQLGRQRHRDTTGDDDERLREVFEQLNLTPEFELLEASPTSSDDEPASPAFKIEPQSPITPKPASPSPLGATGGPPSQHMRQMEKDFANMQYKRLLEAEALEKKKRKELAKEKEVKIKQEKEQAKAIYHQLLEAEKKAKVKKEIKKEK